MNLKKAGKATKPLFLGISLREKALFLLILVVGACFWALSFSGRFDQFSSHLKGLWAIDRNQRAILDGKDLTQMAFAASLANLNKDELPNQNEVFGKIDTLIKQFGINLGIILTLGLIFDLFVLPTMYLGNNKTREAFHENNI